MSSSRRLSGVRFTGRDLAVIERQLTPYLKDAIVQMGINGDFKFS